MEPKKSKKPVAKKTFQLPKKKIKKSRLPNGSRFNLFYNSEEGKWKGTLTMAFVSKTKNGFVQLEFKAEYFTVFGLMIRLDVLYRKWIKHENYGFDPTTGKPKQYDKSGHVENPKTQSNNNPTETETQTESFGENI